MAERPRTIFEAAIRLMQAIDDAGSNPAHPHGGTAINDAMWNLCLLLAAKNAEERANRDG